MKTFQIFQKEFNEVLPEKFQSDDVRFPESLVNLFLEKYTKPGEKILDPFAGFGTTLLATEKKNRIPFGIEFDPERYEYIKSKIFHKSNIFYGDATKLEKYDLPIIDFSFTSPPSIPTPT